MDSGQTQATTPQSRVASNPGLFGTRIPASAAFLVGVLLFLLPFAEVRCNGAAVANNTGLGIAMGHDWNEAGTKNIFGNTTYNDSTSYEEKTRNQDPNMFAIVAIGLGVLGLIIAFLIPRSGGAVNLVIGCLAAASLVAMLFDLRAKIKSENSIKSTNLGLDANVGITVDGTAAFYFAIILFILAGIFSYLRVRNKQPS